MAQRGRAWKKKVHVMGRPTLSLEKRSMAQHGEAHNMGKPALLLERRSTVWRGKAYIVSVSTFSKSQHCHLLSNHVFLSSKTCNQW
eukprot:scaffold123867_cov23-Tisochrysis_lutea.AAC.1